MFAVADPEEAARMEAARIEADRIDRIKEARIIADFPILAKPTSRGKRLVFLDSAASSQTAASPPAQTSSARFRP